MGSERKFFEWRPAQLPPVRPFMGAWNGVVGLHATRQRGELTNTLLVRSENLSFSTGTPTRTLIDLSSFPSGIRMVVDRIVIQKGSTDIPPGAILVFDIYDGSNTYLVQAINNIDLNQIEDTNRVVEAFPRLANPPAGTVYDSPDYTNSRKRNRMIQGGSANDRFFRVTATGTATSFNATIMLFGYYMDTGSGGICEGAVSE